MEYFIFIIVIIVVVLKQIKKMNAGSGSGNSQQSAASRAPQSSSASRPSQPAYRTAGTNAQRYAGSSNAGGFGRTNYRSVGSANITRDGRVYASIDFDNTHYHAEGFDFDCCISFTAGCRSSFAHANQTAAIASSAPAATTITLGSAMIAILFRSMS